MKRLSLLAENSLNQFQNRYLSSSTAAAASSYPALSIQNPNQILHRSPNLGSSSQFLRISVFSRSLQTGKLAHACILKSGVGSDLLIINNLLHSYCSSASVTDALKLFYDIPERDVVSWNTMVFGFSGLGNFEEGFTFFVEMKRVGIRPSQSSFVSVLVGLIGMCCFEGCRQIHGESLKCGFSSDVLVGNSLLTA